MAAAALGFTACEDDKEPVYQDPTTFVLNTPAFAGQYYQLAEGVTVDLTCSQPDYGYAATPDYTVEVGMSETFTDADEATGTEANYFTMKGGNSAAMSLDGKALSEGLLKLLGITSYADFPAEGVAAFPVYIRLYSALKNVTTSGIYSNTICLSNVQPYNCFPQGGRTIYLIGQGTPAGWDINGTAGALEETGVGTNIYMGAYDVPAGELRFRIYQSLGNWGNDGELPSIGSGPNDGTAVDVTITNTPSEYPAVPGKGAWLVSNWEGGYVTFTLDLNDMDNMVLTLQKGNHSTIGKKFIYLVGAPEGWAGPTPEQAEHYTNWRLFDMDNNGIYTGSFEIGAGSAMFRFYTALGSWDENSLGYQAADEPTELTMTNGVYSGSYVEGKGSWSFPAWAGGVMDITVDTNDMTVKFVAAE